jgi:hypothetical protein
MIREDESKQPTAYFEEVEEAGERMKKCVRD